MSDMSSLPPPEPFRPGREANTEESRRMLWIILGSAACVVTLCAVLAIFGIGRSLLSIPTEQKAIAPVIDRFMKMMSQRDAHAAYRLFSSRAQRQTRIADLAALLEGSNYALFDGYKSSAIDGINLTRTMNTNQDVPQGLVATVSGSVSYADGAAGSFRATLEKEKGDWRLFFINVTVPPSKILGE